MPAEEAEEREELLAEVMDPTYLMGRDADADGEAEIQGGDMSVDFGIETKVDIRGGDMVDVMDG